MTDYFPQDHSTVPVTRITADAALEVATPVESWLLLCTNEDGQKVLGIRWDGSVETWTDGAEQDAAKIFYEALQFEGRTLHQQIAALQARVAELEAFLVTYE